MGSIQDRLPRLGVPARLVWGMRDKVFQPVFLEQWQQLLPDADTVEVDDAAHFLVEDQPDAVTQAIAGFSDSL